VSRQQLRTTLETVHLSLRTLPLRPFHCAPARYLWLLLLDFPPRKPLTYISDDRLHDPVSNPLLLLSTASTNFKPTFIVCLLAHSLTTRHTVAMIDLRSHLYVIYFVVSSYLSHCLRPYFLSPTANSRRAVPAVAPQRAWHSCTLLVIFSFRSACAAR
jgi:hypothetical protein